MKEDFAQPLQDHLRKAKMLLVNGKLEDALDEVEAAFPYDPLNEEVLALAREIGERREERFLEELEQASTTTQRPDTGRFPDTAGPKVDPPTVEREDPALPFILTARRFLQRGRIEYALEEIMEGLKVAPESGTLLSMKSQLTGFPPPGPTPGKTSHPGLRGDNVVKNGDPPADNQVDDPVEKRRAEWESCSNFQSAQALCHAGQLEEALVEIALGLLKTPADQNLLALEEAVWQKQAVLRADTAPVAAKPPVPTEGEPAEETESHRLSLHLLAAEQFVKHGEFDKALDELAQAFSVDPDNAGVARLEQQVRSLREQQCNSPLRLVYKNENTSLRTQAQ